VGEMVTNYFNNVYKSKNVLITGNTGFKGSWLSTWLIELGANVYGISMDIPTDPSMFEELGLAGKMEYHNADIRNYEQIKAIIHNISPDFIFHLAAQPIVSLSYNNPIETITTNVIGTANILEVLRCYQKPCSAVIITSDKCYDNVEWVWGYKETDVLGGKDIYSGSKGAAELIVKSYYHSFFKRKESLIKIATARAGNVIGGGDWAVDRIVPDCMRAWSQGKIVEIRSPKATRPWQHVLEPLSGYLQLGQQLYYDFALNGQSFNFGPQAESNYTVQEILEELSERWKFQNPEDAYKITGNVRFHEAGLLKLNCDKALFYFKWLPTLDHKTLINFVGDWYYAYYHKEKDMFSYTVKQIEQYEQLAIQEQRSWTQEL
jgi:CDP-glucose 4,6-dehydratase